MGVPLGTRRAFSTAFPMSFHIRIRALLDSITGGAELDHNQTLHLGGCRLCQDSLKLLIALEKLSDQPAASHEQRARAAGSGSEDGSP